MKLSYYKEVINLTLANQIHHYVFNNNNKKMNIVKIITNSHELPSETRSWSIPKTPWDEGGWHLYNTKRVQHDFFLFLGFLGYYPFSFPKHTTNFLELLSQQNYSDLGMLLSLLFDHRNKK